MYNNVTYVPYNINLNLCSRRKPICVNSPDFIWVFLSAFLSGLLVSDYPDRYVLIIICYHFTPVSDVLFILISLSNNMLIYCKRKLYFGIHRVCFLIFKCLVILLVFIVSVPELTLWYFQIVISISNDISPNPGPFNTNQITVTPATFILCLMIIHTWCSLCTECSLWVQILLTMLSNDIELNPGPEFHENFSFMNWNLNSLAKNNFERVQLIEAHNSIFNYDLISLCETSLNDSVEIPDPLMQDYTFIPANHPGNESHGGVGIFYKNSLPIKSRHDLSFDESIVIELKFGRKKIFFTVLYRSPSFKHSSSEFNDFLSNFKTLHTKIQSENPYASFFTGDFNGHSKFWWPGGDTNPEGKDIEELFSSLNLSQVINEPTNFTPGKNPSCIDFIVTDQPNLVLDSGTRASLDSKCHHQIIHCKVNFRIPPPPPIERKMWHYNKANINTIQRSMANFP